MARLRPSAPPGGGTPLDQPADAAPAPNPALPRPLALLSVLLFCAIAVVTATIEVLLVPVRVGTTIVPVTVLLAAVGNLAVPVLSRQAVDLAVAAVAPMAAWVIVVVVLSQSRPEGDLLLPAITPLIQVTYALLGVGAVAALVGVTYAERRSSARRRVTAPAAPAAPAAPVRTSRNR